MMQVPDVAHADGTAVGLQAQLKELSSFSPIQESKFRMTGVAIVPAAPQLGTIAAFVHILPRVFPDEDYLHLLF
jgi:hypothetical protein